MFKNGFCLTGTIENDVQALGDIVHLLKEEKDFSVSLECLTLNRAKMCMQKC